MSKAKEKPVEVIQKDTYCDKCKGTGYVHIWSNDILTVKKCTDCGGKGHKE